MKKTTLIIFVALAGILALMGKSNYNSMVNNDEEVSKAWSNVEGAYQHRADLVPNLVATVKGYADHEKSTFEAILKFIAPKGVEEEGAVQFKIEGDLIVNDSAYVRAGYSANASIVLEEKKDVLAIKEALLQFDKETQKPFVEIETGENEFERKELELGVSDGIDVEVVSGLGKDDKIKVWNELEKKDDDKD